MPPTVLVCDDEDVLRALIRAALGSDYSVVEAHDGDEAVELARSANPDVIVLDMMMPGRSGLDVLREIRADGDVSAVPVIMLTARTQAGDREAAERFGADRFLAKPFSPLELVSLIDELVDGRS
jgi:two-component system OmpR family response regulator